MEETAERTPAIAEGLASPEVRALFRDGNFRVVDVDNTSQGDVQGYITKSKGKELPRLFLADEKGNFYYEGKLPETVEAMKALVAEKKKGGGK